MTTEDIINNPNHYMHPTIPGLECKDVVACFSYNVGTAMAYLWRANRKHDSPLEDLRKARKHIEFEIERMEKRNETV